MRNCGCKSFCSIGCDISSFIISIIVGIIVGVVFSLGLIPSTITLLIIAIATSAVALGVLVATLIAANNENGCNRISRCICSNGKCVLIGIIGTFLATAIALIIGVAAVTTVAAVFVGIAALFFVFLIINLFSMLFCIINENCKYIDE